MTDSLRSTYRREIDGLRAIAVGAVIIHHLSQNALPSGYLGVDVFFVISGYVITRSLMSRGRKGSHSSLKDALLSFYGRRIKRLLPALSLCVILTTLLGCFFMPSERPLFIQSWRTGLAALFGLSNLYLFRQSTDYFGVDAELNLFTQTWSLGVEEQFYMVFPLMAWWLGISGVKGPSADRLRSIRRMKTWMVVVSVGSFGAYVWLAKDNQAAAYFIVTSRLWELGIGCLVALREPEEAHGDDTASKLTGFLAWLALLGLIGILFVPLSFQVVATTGAVICTALLVTGLTRHGFIYRLLTTRGMVWVGLISYSLYLWHWTVVTIGRWTVGITIATVPILIILMFALASASYYWIEYPFRHRTWGGGHWSPIRRGALLSMGAVGLVLVMAYPLSDTLYLGSNSWGSMTLRRLPDDPAYLQPQCHLDPEATTEKPPTGCVINRAGQPTLFLVGNSHTDHLRPLHLALGDRMNRSIDGVSQSSCEFPANPKRSDQCSDFQSKQMERVLKNAKAGDIVLVSNRYIINDWHTGRNNRSWLEQQGVVEHLNGFAQRMRSRGGRVVLFEPAPEFERNVLYCEPQWFRAAGGEGCSVSRAKLESLRESTHEVIQEKLSGCVERFNPMTHLCESGRCPMNDESKRPLYRDDNHLSRIGAMRLIGPLETMLQGQAVDSPSSSCSP